MFHKILIANRGEIAARIIRTCEKLNIQTVAVYSEADKDAIFVKMADEAYLIGGPRVSESYLNIEKIIEVAKAAQADAIHPGYGLLSENPEFVKRCEEEELVFIGPKAATIAKMGSKIEARKAMALANIPIVPGIEHQLLNVEDAVQTAHKIGYPVMLKASAGGGGIGMQIAFNDVELEKAFISNQKRALNFFGEGSMYMEKYIENPRHIEIQIVADKFGNTVYLWERECSIQRRHQKVIEEAPSPFLSEETRREMGESAVLAAKAIGYQNAGTIEFIVDEEQNYYFLEMNTRLQVEHPVTEEITKLDLVEQQIKIAYGEKLEYGQKDISKEGHAIEARIYAEDPVTFFPSPGTITSLHLPNGPGIRHELGVGADSTVTPFYDPMIAKLIVTANTRNEAIELMVHALQNYEVTGIKTNIPLLLDIFAHEAFAAGNTTTNFIEKTLKV